MVTKRYLGMLLLASVGCASADARFREGMKTFQQGQWQTSISTLEGFTRDNCFTGRSNLHCKEARLTTAEAYLRLGELRKAYRIAEQSRWDEPAGTLVERIDSVQAAAHERLSANFRRDAGTGRVGVRFHSETIGRLRFLRLTLALDFRLLRGDDGRIDGNSASLTIAPTEVSAGEHQLDVIAVYEGAGSVKPDYRFTARHDRVLTLAESESLDVQVTVAEIPGWTSAGEALRVAVDVNKADTADEQAPAAKRWKFAGYFNRLKAKITESWHPEEAYQRAFPSGTASERKNHYTLLRVQVGPDGTLANLSVETASGVEVLDAEAIAAFRRAEPIPKPPRELLDESNLVTFSFGFLFDGKGAHKTRWFKYQGLK